MVKRLFDIAAAATGLVVCGPVIMLAAALVKLSSRGPAFYCPARAGMNGRPFTLYKLRTMHVNQSRDASVVTGANDARVFAVGRWLRKLKIDELPQLLNILRGDMSIVGPRPEDLKIVEQHYGPMGWQTLQVRPGLAGVSSIYNYTHGEKLLTGPNPEQVYAEQLLPVKLALEVAYLNDTSFGYDVSLIVRTVAAIIRISLGQQEFPEPPEMATAREILAQRTSAANPSQAA
ncbi:MAG: sugar transferase [Planctomycetaceae bacterium]|nr:sugar transferase [Planctomycetaceae bacterium]